MRIEILRDADDQARLEAFLLPRLESSLFLLSNSRRAGLADRGRLFEGTYFAAIAEGEITGVAALYWQGNLILQAPEYLEPLVEAAAESPRPIVGLFGLGAQVARALELVGWADSDLQLDEVEGLYVLPLEELAVPEELASGRLRGRRAERRDLDLLTAWRVGYHLEALGATETPELPEQCRAEVSALLERGDTWILEDDGRRVASTSFNATIDEAVQVGGVWTPPESRSRGYGRAAVAASLLGARDDGVRLSILFTGDDNVPAVKAYAALGFRRIGDHRIVLRRA